MSKVQDADWASYQQAHLNCDVLSLAKWRCDIQEQEEAEYDQVPRKMEADYVRTSTMQETIQLQNLLESLEVLPHDRSIISYESDDVIV